MRLFAALDVPDDIRHEIAAWWVAAGALLPVEDWRDVAERNWHVTLAFYGDVGGNELDDLAEELTVCAAETSPLRLQTSQYGVFPRASRPRVFWAGVDSAEGGKDLKYLARCCRLAGRVTLRKHGAKEAPFRGHITLARAAPEAVPLGGEIWQAMPDLPVLEWTAGALSLYASTLRPQGPVYRLVEVFEFKGNHHVR